MSSPHSSALEEDAFGQYSRLLLKYFLAEGVMCGHSLLLASASEEPPGILKVKAQQYNDDVMHTHPHAHMSCQHHHICMSLYFTVILYTHRTPTCTCACTHITHTHIHTHFTHTHTHTLHTTHTHTHTHTHTGGSSWSGRR